MKGKVFLVGAGPGDPELLTRKGWRILQRADVVLHDALVSDEVLACVSAHARILHVGKRCGRKACTQQQIHAWMIAYAEAGLMVARLKGGDPLLFGRAGEEMDALRDAGIEFEVIPGVTAAFAAAAAAQVPLTERRRAAHLVFLTNHRYANATGDWSGLISSDATTVIYMPGANYVDLAARLTVAGLMPDTPIAIISAATTPLQQIHRTTLRDLGAATPLPAPAVVIVGRATAVHPQFSREQIPLAVAAR
ncbi:MAG: uroporphyrinogen-III C-methyltransferase [Candidatus Acidiferrales bacterium]